MLFRLVPVKIAVKLGLAKFKRSFVCVSWVEILAELDKNLTELDRKIDRVSLIFDRIILKLYLIEQNLTEIS